MNAVIALFVGAVVFLLAVESVYDPQRTANHVNKYRTHPHLSLSIGKFLNDGVKENNKEKSDAPHHYEKDEQRRYKRSINKRLANRFARQKNENPFDIQKLFKLDEIHKIRHHHDRNLSESERQKLSLKSRIIIEGRKDIDRRKRYSYVTKDGVVHYTYSNPAVACNGWAYYSPYACVHCGCQNEACFKPCKNAGSSPLPLPHVTPPHIYKPTSKPAPPIYSGPGKYWIGPKLGCNCNPRGSELSTCDITTGQCRCKHFYVGRTCDKCQNGYWERGNECVKCDCDMDGSKSSICDSTTGQCDCKPGVGGFSCSTCTPHYFGFSTSGCKACDPCDKKGHICDPDTGHCICPSYSYGEYCQICSLNTWGYEPDKGCKICNCSQSGSLSMQCNLLTGDCSCKLGYTGTYCDRCAHGYYGYPRCRRCNCNYAGTDKYLAQCDNTGVCQCSPDGHCPCKANVFGRKCDKCKDGTFGLHLENTDGCTRCFCFGRSSKCSESGLTWDRIRINSSRTLTLNHQNYDNPNKVQSIEISEKLLVIPGIHGNVTTHRYHFDSPLYWKLHPVFNGDRILSYGGYLSFVSHTQNSRQRLPQDIINHYPLVQLRGHGKITLEYYPPLPSTSNRHEVRFHESLWKRIYPKDTHLSPRELFMITLQNVQNIFIKATDSSDFESLILQDAILDTAIEVLGSPPPFAGGVEICECPRQYNSSSCQDPSIGFFRDSKPYTANGTILIDTFIGQAKPCQCNGRSNTCNIEDGYCLSCSANTDGRYCEKCADGFYGNPMIPFGTCDPCPCPLPNQNFAKACSPSNRQNQFICVCREGYTGAKCDKCSSGYYGQPQIPGGSCLPCNCNIEGKASDDCDSETGQCNCKPGVTGKQCSQCEKPRHVLEKFECTPCDTCSQWLLDDIDELSNNLHANAYFLNGTVQPPWKKLKDLEFRYGHLNDKFVVISESQDFVNDVALTQNLTELQLRLDDMKRNLSSKNPEAVLENGRNVLSTAEEILTNIRDDKYRLQLLMKTLENFGNSHVDTKEAVRRAEVLLNEIKIIDQNVNYPNENVFEKCKNVKELIERMLEKPSIDITELQTQLSNLNERMEDLETVAVQAEIKNDQAEVLNRGNEFDLESLKEKISMMEELNKTASDDLAQIKTTLNQTSDVLDKMKDYMSLLNNSELNNLKEELERRQEELSKFDVDMYLEMVEKHVQQLEINATNYGKFNLTSREIDALKASEAYANIKKIIDEAEELASKALSEVNTALDTLSPEGKDSIAINTSISLADSERLKIRITHQRENLAGIKQKKDNLVLQVTTLDSNNWSNGLKNREQDTALREIKNEISKIDQKKIEDLIKGAIKETDKIKSVHRKLMDIAVLQQSEIEKPLQRLQTLLSTEKLRKLEEQLEVTKDTLKNVFQRNQTYMDIIQETKNKYDEFKSINNSIARNMDELKAKIDNAKKSADRIRISLTGPTCARTYLLNNLSPSLTTKLLISFNYSSNRDSDVTSSLFKLSTTANQFMNLTIAKDILQFEWKLGENINNLVFTNPLIHNSFYTIEIERIGNYAEMSVNKIKVSKMSEYENQTVIFRAEPTDLMQIGPGLSGCLRDIFFDTYRIGLWNFQTTSGKCFGCIRSNELTLENTYDFYKGDGYSEIAKEYQERNANPGKFNVQFSLRTFDENALLFLAADPERKSYLAVSLKDGFVQYEIHYANNDDIVLRSKQKFNNGEKVKVSAEKVWKKNSKQDIAVLKINDEVLLSEKRSNIDSSAVLRLKKVNYYFGGVPPDYFLKSNGASSNLHTHASLLGGLDDLKEYQPFNDEKIIEKFGVGRQSGELEYQQVWFEGDGYLHLQTSKFQNQVVFLLKTKETNCFLMLVNNITLFNVVNGKISITLDFSNKKILTSNEIVNDNEYHLIELDTTDTTASLKINGILQDTVRYENIETDLQDDTIYLGGGKPVQHIFGNQNLFSGVISDIVVDNKLVRFDKNSIKSFEHAKIGRNERKKNLRITKATKKVNVNSDNNPSNIKEMQNTESCGESPNYTFDPSAAKFGDKPHSHVLHYLKDNFWRKDYTIEIQFRTLQPSGLLFLAFGPRQQFNLLEVKNGKLNFKANGKRIREVSLPQKIDDGNWYTIIVEVAGLKKKRKLTLAINGFKTKPIRPPRNKLFREFFIGGVSQNTTVPSIIRNILHPFKGCMRGLKLNKKFQTLIKDKSTIHHNIGQCFPHIEKGSYFGGDAYAIYNKFFHIDQTLELSLQFRTSEQNGILLSVSNPRNSPALAVELQNGAIVMTTDNGYGTVTNVTNNLSDFALCNNQWHNVTAVYTSTEITINVDGIRKIWVQPNEETLMDELEAPLYIGGLPDYAPVGTLKMKENFKGCIKNIKIGENIADWSKMEKISNILLDSCPTIQ